MTQPCSRPWRAGAAVAIAVVASCAAPRPPVAAPPVRATPVASPVVHAPPERTPVTLADTWPTTQSGSPILAVPLAGAYGKLDDVCAALDDGSATGPDGESPPCTSAADEPIGAGPITALGSVRVWESPAPPDADGEPDVRMNHLAVQAHGRWYLMPNFADTGNRYASFFYEGELVGDVLVVRYRIDTPTAGRFASDTELGVVACKYVAGAVACTPKLVTGQFSQAMDTNQPDWPTTTTVSLACTATFANGALTLAPATAAAPNEPPESWTAEAAARCSGGAPLAITF